MIYEIIVFGGFWFWLLVGIELYVLFRCIAEELGAIGGISIIITLVLLQFFSNIDVYGFITNNPFVVLGIIGLYLLGGILWVFPRWYFFVKSHYREYIELKRKFLNSKGQITDKIPEELMPDWDLYFESNRGYGLSRIEFKPSPADHKDRIVTWMCLWPISLVWTIISDSLVRFFQHVYYKVHGMLQIISDRIFKDVENEYNKRKN